MPRKFPTTLDNVTREHIATIRRRWLQATDYELSRETGLSVNAIQHIRRELGLSRASKAGQKRKMSRIERIMTIGPQNAQESQQAADHIAAECAKMREQHMADMRAQVSAGQQPKESGLRQYSRRSTGGEGYELDPID